jgi:hypothetical protein
MPKSEPGNLFADFGKADEHPDVKQLPPPKPNHIVDVNKMVIPPAPHNGTATSRAAALALDPDWRATQCGKFLTLIENSWERGITREELSTASGQPIQTTTGRVNDLLKMGLIYEPAGVTRMTKSGRQAQVVRVKP